MPPATGAAAPVTLRGISSSGVRALKRLRTLACPQMRVVATGAKRSYNSSTLRAW